MTAEPPYQAVQSESAPCSGSIASRLDPHGRMVYCIAVWFRQAATGMVSAGECHLLSLERKECACMDGDGVRIWFCSSVCMRMREAADFLRTAFLSAEA